MASKKIEELLNKYWNCESSLEEEQQLREFFRQQEIPQQWSETAGLFRYFDLHKKKELTDPLFERAVMDSVQSGKKGKIKSLVLNTMRIAAGISVLMIAVWFAHQEIKKSNSTEVVDTYDDPKLAFEETKKALQMISKSFGTAEKQAKKINLFNEVQREIQAKSETTKTNL
jgi:hypothetical protein